MSYRLTPKAGSDLRRILLTIAADNPQAALAFQARCTRTFENLSANPGMGAPREEVLPGLRIHPVGRYLICYRQEERDVLILRVLHGAQQWEELLR